jgi:hypothetical protein
MATCSPTADEATLGAWAQACNLKDMDRCNGENNCFWATADPSAAGMDELEAMRVQGDSLATGACLPASTFCGNKLTSGACLNLSLNADGGCWPAVANEWPPVPACSRGGPDDLYPCVWGY